MQPLNSPLELGLRALVVLTAAHPNSLDVDRLVLLDHCLLHSADLGGPPSVLPPVPARGGELAIKRSVIEHGVQVMARANLVDIVATRDGLTYRASEEAAPFLRLIKSPLVAALADVAGWAIIEFGGRASADIRQRIGSVSSQWDEQWGDETAITWSVAGTDEGEASL